MNNREKDDGPLLFPDAQESYDHPAPAAAAPDSDGVAADDADPDDAAWETRWDNRDSGDDDPCVAEPAWVRAHLPRVDLAEEIARRAPARRRPSASRLAAAALVAAAAVLGTAAVAAAVGGGSPPTQAPATAAAAASSTAALPAASAAPQWCEESGGAGSYVSASAGDPATAVGAVLAFEHAYYVERDAGAAAALMAAPPRLENLQAGIDEVPSGTRHCVTVTTTDDPLVVEVVITLRTTSGNEGEIPQTIALVDNDAGGYLIASIDQAAAA